MRTSIFCHINTPVAPNLPQDFVRLAVCSLNNITCRIDLSEALLWRPTFFYRKYFAILDTIAASIFSKLTSISIYHKIVLIKHDARRTYYYYEHLNICIVPYKWTLLNILIYRVCEKFQNNLIFREGSVLQKMF